METFDTRYGGPAETTIETSAFRRIYTVPHGRLLLDLAADGRVRQITLGRERSAGETWEPDPDDWSLDHARRLSRPWLPADAAPVRSEPFVFQDEVAGTREVFQSAALRAVFPLEVYRRHGALGPSGACAITYYQTRTGGVAFTLIGLY